MIDNTGLAVGVTAWVESDRFYHKLGADLAQKVMGEGFVRGSEFVS